MEQKKALLVENSSETSDIVTNILIGAGYSVKVALDGKEGLITLYSKKNYFDLIIAEIDMAGTHGPHFIKMTRNERRHQKTPIIAIADEFGKSRLKACVDAGATDFLLKPFEPADLIKVIKLFSPQYPAQY